MTQETKSDLIDLVHHEHHHLTSLFGSLHSTFEILSSEALDSAERQEIVETAAEDLQTAFDDMLHHFSQEEEVFFVEMEKRFPELGEDIAKLVATHEFVYERTRWLQNLLQQRAEAIAQNAERIFDTLTTLDRTLVEHTQAENVIFTDALRRMTPPEREEILRKMREI